MPVESRQTSRYTLVRFLRGSFILVILYTVLVVLLSGKSLNLCLWDFCGDPFYLYPHYLFHEQPSITVLTFSMPDYSAHNFAQQVSVKVKVIVTLPSQGHCDFVQAFSYFPPCAVESE